MRDAIETIIEGIDTDFFSADVGDEFVTAMGEEEYKLLAEELEVSPKLIKAIANSMQFMGERIVEQVSDDLRDIWKRLS